MAASWSSMHPLRLSSSPTNSHGIFRTHDLFWNPLPPQEFLQPGQYYLLPLQESGIIGQLAQVGHERSNSAPQSCLGMAAYRMSFDRPKRPQTEVLSWGRDGGGKRSGFWKVKLVISPQHLLEILSKESRTQELIESVRTVAKCGGSGGLSSMASSDQWSLSSTTSRNASSSKNDCLLELMS